MRPNLRRILQKSDADNAYSLAIQVKTIELAAQSDAKNAITSAKSVIDSASASKTDAQNAVNDAKTIGADVGSAQTFLDTAISKLDSANAKYNEANSFFSNLKWSDAKSSANQAESYANDASTNAINAKSSAKAAADAKRAADAKAAADAAAAKAAAETQAKNEQTQTESKLNNAQTSYDSVFNGINSTKEAITLLSTVGVDTSEFTKNLNDVSSTIVDAEAELNKAKSRYETKELSESRAYSESSLGITEKDLTILDENGKKMKQALLDKFADNYSSTNNSYYIALKSLDESKAKISGDVYVSKKEKLDDAKKSLDNASNLMSHPKTGDDIKNAFSELQKSKSLSEEIVPKSAIPSFEAIGALIGLSIAYLVILRRKNIF
jgi:hypothetical protein